MRRVSASHTATGAEKNKKGSLKALCRNTFRETVAEAKKNTGGMFHVRREKVGTATRTVGSKEG